jgi:methylated-DNA-protein-cysteine methyltransferase related protein
MDGPKGWQEYYAVVRRIPRGKVATYAQVALLAGRPRAARHVGYALAALRGAKHRIPWQRVLGKRSARWAGISILDPMGAAAQRRLLELEGVAVDERGRVSLEEFGWATRPASTERRARVHPGAPRR